MKPLSWNAPPERSATSEPLPDRRSQIPTPPSATLNTILAVREHAPAEIEELSAEIESLHHRLSAAHARKRLLEQLLEVITQADTDRQQGSMSVMR